MKVERISWIDVCRGIGIIIVVYAHGLSGDGFRYLFYSFHMPLFFFLSGLVFHLKKHERFITLLKKATKGILLPYIFFALLGFLLWLLNDPTQRSFGNITHHLIGILYGNGSNGYLPFNVVLWFLPCLFITRLACTFLIRFFKKEQYLYLSLFVFSLVGFAFSKLFPTLKLPFGLETALTAIVFFGAGFLVHEHAKNLTKLLKRHLALIFTVSLFLCVLFATMNYQGSGHQIDLRLNRLDNYFFFYLAALSGILATLTLSILIQKNRVLEYIGKYSLILFVWHNIVFAYITKGLLLFMTEETIQSLRNLYLAPLYTLLSFIIILTLNIVFSKLFLRKNKIQND